VARAHTTSLGARSEQRRVVGRDGSLIACASFAWDPQFTVELHGLRHDRIVWRACGMRFTLVQMYRCEFGLHRTAQTVCHIQ